MHTYQKSLLNLFFFGFSCLCLFGCASSKTTKNNYHPVKAERYQGRSAGHASAPRARRYDRSVKKSVQAPRPSSEMARRRRYVPRSPGLGTAYGESRYAPVNYTTFQRSSSSPSQAFRFDYNDLSGVQAIVRRLSRVACCSPLGSTYHGGVSVQLVDRYGSAFKGVRVGGRNVVVGQHGKRYVIRVKNHLARRIEVVASVDGLDVIDGRRASVHKRGYVVRPHSTLQIKGFRRSHRYVAAFRFSTLRRSYASRMGKGGNIGVIGVAVFSEKRPEPYLQRRLQARPFVESGFTAPPY